MFSIYSPCTVYGSIYITYTGFSSKW